MKQKTLSEKYVVIKERREAKFNIVFGNIFLLWSAIDIAVDLYADLWYVHVPFILLGVAFIWQGFKGLKMAKALEEELASQPDATDKVPES